MNGDANRATEFLRHLKSVAKDLDLPREVDFRRFRTMHASLMRRTRAQPEVARDNMGHSEISMTLEGYGRTWWDERKTAVSAVVDTVMKSEETDDLEQYQTANSARRMLFQSEAAEIANGVPATIVVESEPAKKVVSD